MKNSTLSTLGTLYFFLAVLTILGSFGAAFWVSTELSNYNQPNYGAGVLVFALGVGFALGFILISELITLAIRVENHLDVIQRHYRSEQKAIDLDDEDLDDEDLDDEEFDDEDEEYEPLSGINLKIKDVEFDLHTSPASNLNSVMIGLIPNVARPIEGISVVYATGRDSTGNWVYTTFLYEEAYISGWINVNSLNNPKKSEIKQLSIMG